MLAARQARNQVGQPNIIGQHGRSPMTRRVTHSVCSRPPPSVVATGDSTAQAPPVEVSQPAAPPPLHGKAVRCRCPRRRRRRLRQARRRRCNSGRTSGWSRRFQSAAGRARLWELWWARWLREAPAGGRRDRTRTMCSRRAAAAGTDSPVLRIVALKIGRSGRRSARSAGGTGSSPERTPPRGRAPRPSQRTASLG